MKVKVLKQFRDKKEEADRKVGDEFIVSKERFEEINSTWAGKLVEEIKEENLKKDVKEDKKGPVKKDKKK